MSGDSDWSCGEIKDSERDPVTGDLMDGHGGRAMDTSKLQWTREPASYTIAPDRVEISTLR